MEGQGKRLILAVALALGIVILWNLLFPGSKPKPKPQVDESAEKEDIESQVGRARDAKGPELAPPAGEPTLTTREYGNVVVTFSDIDGKLVSWRLTDAKYERDWSKGEMIADPERGSFLVNFIGSDFVLPAGARWTPITTWRTGENERDLGADEVGYRLETADLIVEKKFLIRPGDYLLELDVRTTLKPGPGNVERKEEENLAITVIGQQDPKAPRGGGRGRSTREHRAACKIEGVRQVSAKKLAEMEEPTTYEWHGRVRWAGFNHPYLFFEVAPDPEVDEPDACHLHPILPKSEEDRIGLMQVDIVFEHEPSSNSVQKQRVVAYIGPKHLDALEDADDLAGFSTGFDSSVNLGWFSFIARPLLWLLTWFHGFVGNWGLSIILLTVMVKLATLYWTTKSMRSMRRMGALQPQIKELQAKYGEDRQKLQQETMALYKANGVNPISGCLPMLLQMPIWLALYKMLSSVGELYLAPFIPGWIDDLTQTDPYHILPVLVTGMMFSQSRLSPTSLDNVQQKILIYGMPLIFGVMSFFFPSGLSLYILTNSTLSLLHTIYMKKFDKSAKKTPAVVKPPEGKAEVPKARAAAKKAAAKPVVDVEAEEIEEKAEPESADEPDDEGGDEEGDDEPASSAPAKNVSTPQQRRTHAPRRKRKRKH